MSEQLLLIAAADIISASIGRDARQLFESLSASSNSSQIEIIDEAKLKLSIHALVQIGSFSDLEAKTLAHKYAWNIAGKLGIYPASIDALYRQFGANKLRQFTVPAMNMRAIAYQSARGVFQAMYEHNVGAAIFELSRGEIGFTGQRPMEYATNILCAAITESFSGPLFLQGDHFQISATRFAEDPETEIKAVKDLIAEAIAVGFYNIDIDTSTLVDLSFDKVEEQQRPNFLLSAELANFTRGIEPDGLTISLGGEIGEVGDENSTVEEVKVYLFGFLKHLDERYLGLTKLSIQSGTKHGGNVLPDGSFGEMDVDFPLIEELTAACRATDGLAGCVQHGASMLSLEKIGNLHKADCIEVHLAAAFLNVVYDNLPETLVEQADTWLKENFAGEWKPSWSEAQFLHHARRYPIGPFKSDWWAATTCHDKIRDDVCKIASAYFLSLGVSDTKELVHNAIKHLPMDWEEPSNRHIQNNDDEAEIKDLAS